MKWTIFLLPVVLASLLSSCKKDLVKNDGLYGKWRLVQEYDGYVNGGSFTWHNIPFNSSHSLEFTSSGQYIKNDVFSGICSGTYTLAPDSVLNIVSSCNTLPETMKISELTNTRLIIIRSVIEGVIKFKYIPEQ